MNSISGALWLSLTSCGGRFAFAAAIQSIVMAVRDLPANRRVSIGATRLRWPTPVVGCASVQQQLIGQWWTGNTERWATSILAVWFTVLLCGLVNERVLDGRETKRVYRLVERLETSGEVHGRLFGGQTPIESLKVLRLQRIPNGHLIAKQLLAVVIELQLHKLWTVTTY